MAGISRPIYSIDDIPGVNAPSPVRGNTLLHNGTEWVNAMPGTTFDFSVASFTDNQSSPQLCGVLGEQWKAAGAISFTASYTNGTDMTSAHIVHSGWSDLDLSDPFTSVSSAEAVNYPAVGSTLTWTLHAAKGAETDENNTTTVAFYNYIYYGVLAKSSGYDESDIESLTPGASPELSNTLTRTITLAPSAQYLIYAVPSRIITEQGEPEFWIGGINQTGGFIKQDPAIEITNSAGCAENYDVYSSINPISGSVTIEVR
jgi:hypothetical protein